MNLEGMGVYCWFRDPLPPERKIAMIRDAGFDSIALWWGDEYDATDGSRFDIMKLAESYHLTIQNFHAPYPGVNALWGPSPGQRERILGFYASCLQDCAACRVNTLVIHVDDLEFTYDDTNQAAAVKGIAEIATLAERLGVRLAIENYTSFQSVWAILSRIRSDSLGFCYDSGHAHCFTKGCGFLDAFGSRLFEIHLHDNDGKADRHMLPGDGTIDWELLSGQIRRTNYSGPVFLEVTDALSERYRNQSAAGFLHTAASRANMLREQILRGPSAAGPASWGPAAP